MTVELLGNNKKKMPTRAGVVPYSIFAVPLLLCGCGPLYFVIRLMDRDRWRAVVSAVMILRVP